MGHTPLRVVEADLEGGASVKIRVEGLPREVLMWTRVVFRKDAPPAACGPRAGRESQQ